MSRALAAAAYVAHANMTTGAFVETPLTEELTIPTGTAARTPFYLDMGDVAFTGYKIGAQVKVRVSRIPATGGTEYSGKIFITQCGLHIQKDTLGSRTEGAK